MELIISKSSEELGLKAAEHAAQLLRKTIDKKGEARLLLSTGASQFSTIDALVKKDVDWSKVEMFHLDEYVDLGESHFASFRKYLKERFVSHVSLKKAHYVIAEGDIDNEIRKLTEEIRRAPIDVALIGIGENAHIAFNDPPANFETKKAFMKVKLDDKCKLQQVGEGWFDTLDDVPDEAITMTVYQILQSENIITCVPHKAKAKAIKDTLELDVTNLVPATILKTHKNWTLYLDEESASLINN